ncbi:MAG: winged helix-turn-helix domain-containing protein [Vicinamibacteria bacterium]
MDLTFGPFRLRDDGLLFAGDRHVPLTPTEEGVLRALAATRGGLVTKNSLVAAVWNGAAVSDASVSRAIHTLRRRLAATPGGEEAIETVYARGYRLALPVAAEPPSRRSSPVPERSRRDGAATRADVPSN